MYFKETAHTHTHTNIQKAYLYIKSSNIDIHFWSFPGLFNFKSTIHKTFYKNIS